jgi:hypothetical protein
MPGVAQSGIFAVTFPLLVLTDAARSLALAACAVAIARPVVRWLATRPEARRPWMWALLLAPLLTPTLLVSYAYAPVAFHAASALHFVGLLLRFVPVAVVVLHFVPPLASAESLHCHALLAPSSRERRRFQLRAAGSGPWLAGGLVFLLVFSDFELASLWSLKTWTVTLFDAHTGGLALGESLRLAAWPLALQLAALFALARRSGPAPEGAWTPPAPRAGRAAVSYLICAGFAAALLPLAIVAMPALRGAPSLAASFTLTGDLAASLAFAGGAAVCASGLARPLRFTLGGPGLLGPLILALLIVALFQLPLARFAYDTPLPLLLALTLLLLPLALLIRWRLAASDTDTSLHVARTIAPAIRHSSFVIRHSTLLWQLDGRRRFACFALLFYWAFTEFTASSILAPVGLTPVFARLHNLAHYGQTAVLSAMLLAATLAPVAVLLLTALVARFYPRRDGR